MPFGKYKGTKLKDVPVEYFHWAYHEFLKEDRDSNLTEYIETNKKALQEENDDLIWD